MCVVSYIGDQYRDDFPKRWPTVPLQPFIPVPPSQSPHPFRPTQDALDECEICQYGEDHEIHALFKAYRKPPLISREEFNALRKEVKELKELLLAAKRFDEATGQADCEMDEKVWFIRRLAEYVGVDVDEVFGRPE